MILTDYYRFERLEGTLSKLRIDWHRLNKEL